MIGQTIWQQSQLTVVVKMSINKELNYLKVKITLSNSAMAQSARWKRVPEAPTPWPYEKGQVLALVRHILFPGCGPLID
ncbi:hypothetical protein Cylst_3426 [Cylindrospermum stagnale PCC 7417]|uniref:Uncharacterized protein n=1 Tax=Cylindrospermum stagnale PCC 7417 TaxID=56107 RepID=K9X0M3_9NOST|nr:hypothetical protein [Cylindrospermum stagnale]AFZ25576.1 hypothetical protein Cylst_3426 [Cylindrospermum stagnale PCC 7417]